MSMSRNHIFHYTIILGIILLGIGLLILLSANKALQFIALIVISFFYLMYGILHHRLEHDLTLKIVIEYILVVFLVIALFIFVKGGV